MIPEKQLQEWERWAEEGNRAGNRAVVLRVQSLINEVRRLREENENLREEVRVVTGDFGEERRRRASQWPELEHLRRIKEAAQEARQEAREGATEGGALARGRLVVIHGLLDEALEGEAHDF